MLERQYTDPVFTKDMKIASTAEIGDEGQILVSLLESGQEVVKPCAGVAGEKFIGCVWDNRQKPLTMATVIEHKVQPMLDENTGTEIFALDTFKKLVPTEVLVLDETKTAMTMAADAASVVAGQYYANPDSGRFTFHEDDEGKMRTIQFRYMPTFVELANNGIFQNYDDTNEHVLGQVGAILAGTIWTDHVDMSVIWTDASTVKLAAGGKLTNETGTGEDVKCTIVHVPTPDYPVLGIRFGLQ